MGKKKIRLVVLCPLMQLHWHLSNFIFILFIFLYPFSALLRDAFRCPALLLN